VPALLISPWIPPGSIVRPPGATPFDHTSIIATLRKLFPFAPLTPRDATAPDLLTALTGDDSNDGPAFIVAPEPVPAPTELAKAVTVKPNGMQRALATTAMLLPTAGANIGAHAQRLANIPDTAPTHQTAGLAAADITTHLQAFFGTL
jgi:phospholipase C